MCQAFPRNFRNLIIFICIFVKETKYINFLLPNNFLQIDMNVKDEIMIMQAQEIRRGQTHHNWKTKNYFQGGINQTNGTDTWITYNTMYTNED